MRRWQCCGADMTWLARCIPCSAWVAPEWWYRYSRRQRRIILTLAAFAAALLVLGLLLFILVASTSGLQAQHRNAEGGKAVSVDAAKYPECAWAALSLPGNVTPAAYSLSLQADLAEPFCVNGSVEVDLNVTTATPCVVMHAAGLTITHAALLEPHTHGAPCCAHSLARAGNSIAGAYQIPDLAHCSWVERGLGEACTRDCKLLGSAYAC